MKTPKYKTRLTLLIVFATVVLTLICLLIVRYYRTGEEATVGIFSLAATLIGTIFIAVELKNGQDVTCSEMLINLNNYFHDSDRLMKVYEVLEHCEMDGDHCEERWKNVSSVEVAQYCTFFENLYLLYRHHIANSEDLDDLFGYRFFLFTNNPYIQEHYLLPTSSSYAQIFELYKIWIEHRCSEGGEGSNWSRNIPGSSYIIPRNFLEDKLYLYDTGYSDYHKEVGSFDAKGVHFSLKSLTFDEMDEILKLQDRVMEALPDKSLLYPLSRAELMESLQLDYLAGAYSDEGDFAGFCLLVKNRPGNRNLASDFGANNKESITFDMVAVAPEWRGYGLQQHFIDWSLEIAESCGAKYIHATVNPLNSHSKDNFLKRGFKVHATTSKYGGLTRDLLVKSI